MWRLTCALGGGHIGTGLVLEEQSAVVRAGVDVARWIRARAVTTIIREGHRPAKRTSHGRRLLAEHRVQQRIARNVRAEGRQSVLIVAVGCKRRRRIEKLDGRGSIRAYPAPKYESGFARRPRLASTKYFQYPITHAIS